MACLVCEEGRKVNEFQILPDINLTGVECQVSSLIVYLNFKPGIHQIFSSNILKCWSQTILKNITIISGIVCVTWQQKLAEIYHSCFYDVGGYTGVL